MAKELPYFRFTVAQWMNGDISMEGYECKGLFADICAWYWFKDCSTTKAMLEKKFTNTRLLQLLYDSEVLKVDGENIHIEFLNDQFDLLSDRRKARQDAGRKGGKHKSSNAKAMLKQKSSYKDKDKEKDKDKDNNGKRKKLMKNSNVSIQDIKESFLKADDLKSADANYYFNAALDWSDSNNQMRVDWIATIRGFARRDLRDNKLKVSNHKQDGGTNLSIEKTEVKPVSESAMTREQWRQSEEYKKFKNT